MKCCYSGTHKCEKCCDTFYCEGAGGFSGRTRDDYGRITCDDCYQNSNIPSVCWYCSTFFPSRTKLFHHLNENPEHKCDYPKVCSNCNELLMKKNIYGGCYNFTKAEIYKHMYYCSVIKNKVSKR